MTINLHVGPICKFSKSNQVPVSFLKKAIRSLLPIQRSRVARTSIPSALPERRLPRPASRACSGRIDAVHLLRRRAGPAAPFLSCGRRHALPCMRPPPHPASLWPPCLPPRGRCPALPRVTPAAAGSTLFLACGHRHALPRLRWQRCALQQRGRYASSSPTPPPSFGEHLPRSWGGWGGEGVWSPAREERGGSPARETPGREEKRQRGRRKRRGRGK